MRRNNKPSVMFLFCPIKYYNGFDSNFVKIQNVNQLEIYADFTQFQHYFNLAILCDFYKSFVHRFELYGMYEKTKKTR